MPNLPCKSWKLLPCVNEKGPRGTTWFQGEEIKKIEDFKFFGSILQSNGDCGKEVKNPVEAGWNGWRKVSGVMCDKSVSAKVKSVQNDGEASNVVWFSN